MRTESSGKAFLRSAFSAGILFMAASPAAHAAPGDPIGPPFLVNTTTDRWEQRPDVARSAMGQRVVVWDDEYNIFAQRFAADGSRLGDQIAVNTSSTGERRDAKVAIDASGAFVVSWYGTSERSVFRRFTADGQPASGEMSFAGGAIAVDADGDMVVAYEAVVPAEANRHAVFAQCYAPDGTPVGEAQRVSPDTGMEHYDPEVVMSPDGDFVVAWMGYGRTSSRDSVGTEVTTVRTQVWTRHYDAAGSARTPARMADAQTTRSVYALLSAGTGRRIMQGLGLTMNEGGAYVVAWADNPAYTGFGRISYRRYAPDDVASKIVRVTRAAGANVAGVAAALNGAGDLVVSWSRHRSSPADHGLFYRRMDAENTPRAAARLVPTTDQGLSLSPTIAMEPTGNFTIYWTGNPAPGDNRFSGVAGQDFEGP